jgi:hypothetical protein
MKALQAWSNHLSFEAAENGVLSLLSIAPGSIHGFLQRRHRDSFIKGKSMQFQTPFRPYIFPSRRLPLIKLVFPKNQPSHSNNPNFHTQWSSENTLLPP